MSSDNGITELHLTTFEGYIAKQIELQQMQLESQQKSYDDLNTSIKLTQESVQQTQISLQQLAVSFNELVIAEKYRKEEDERTQRLIAENKEIAAKEDDRIKEVIAENKVLAKVEIDKINATLKENADGARWAGKMAKWIDNYIMKVAVPFTITALIIIIVANTFDLEKWVK